MINDHRTNLVIADLIYLFVLGVTGFFLVPAQWLLAAGVLWILMYATEIFYVKLFRDRYRQGSQWFLTRLISAAIFWPLLIISSVVDLEFAPLIVCAGITARWIITAWIHGLRACFNYAWASMLGSLMIWLNLPDQRFTTVPFFVAAIYLGSLKELGSGGKASRCALTHGI